MIAYFTFLGVFALLIIPISFVVAFVVFIVKMFRLPKAVREIYPGADALMETVAEDSEEGEYEECAVDFYEELTFCQLFRIGKEMCLLVDHVEMCPDETAFIRVVDDEGFTPLYKRKVRRDKEGKRFIVFNSTNYYLNDNKTQPVISKK